MHHGGKRFNRRVVLYVLVSEPPFGGGCDPNAVTASDRVGSHPHRSAAFNPSSTCRRPVLLSQIKYFATTVGHWPVEKLFLK